MTPPQGLDISSYQATTPDLTGIDFVFVRATNGNVDDPDYPMHAADVLRAGKVLGAYEFGVNGLTGAEQARLFLSRVGATTKLVALDVEGGTPPTTQQAADWVAACKAAGCRAGIYHSLSGFPDVGEDFRWVAFWSRTEPTIPWDFWQFVGSPLDHDTFNGTLARLYTLAKLPLPDTSTGDPMDPAVNPPATTLYDIKAGVSVYGDPGRQTVLVAKYAGAKSVPFYYTATLPALSCFRLNLQTAASPKYVLAYVGADALTPTVDPTPFSQADITSASSKALISGFNAGRQAVLDAGAAVPVKQ